MHFSSLTLFPALELLQADVQPEVDGNSVLAWYGNTPSRDQACGPLTLLLPFRICSPVSEAASLTAGFLLPSHPANLLFLCNLVSCSPLLC